MHTHTCEHCAFSEEVGTDRYFCMFPRCPYERDPKAYCLVPIEFTRRLYPMSEGADKGEILPKDRRTAP